LPQAGIRYVCDWVNDEQPYAMKTSQGELYALPIMLELDDIHALWERRVPIDRYGGMLQESFDVLYRDGQQNGRLLVLHLHPWLIGQPFRLCFLHPALGHMSHHQGAWAADCGLVPGSRACGAVNLNVEENTRDAGAFAIQQVAHRGADRVDFGNHGTTDGHISQRPEGHKQASEPVGRTGGGHRTDTL